MLLKTNQVSAEHKAWLGWLTVTALYLVVRKWLHKTHTHTHTARVRTQVSEVSRGRDPLELNQDEQKMVAADTLADSAGTKAHKPAT